MENPNNKFSSSGGLVADGLDVHEVLEVLRSRRYVILAFVIASLILSALYLEKQVPIYQADALIQVETKSGPLDALSDLGSVDETPAKLATEIEIVKSRSIMYSVVESLGLDVRAEPEQSGGILEWGDNVFDLFARAFLGAEDRRGKGAELVATRFEVPPEQVGASFYLEASTGSRYSLIGPRGDVLGQGQVGQMARFNLDGEEVRLFVKSIRLTDVAQRFRLRKIHWLRATKSLQSSLQVSALPRNDELMRLVHLGPDPQMSVAILNAVAETYLEKNVTRKSEQAQRTLKFLQAQLPKQEASLRGAEQKLNRFLSRNKSLDLESETQSLLSESVRLEGELSKVDQRRVELSENLTALHPAVRALDEQRAKLRSARNQLDQRIQDLPEQQREALRLNRDVEVNSTLYTYLLNKSQELKLIKAGTVGNVRIVDYAAAKTNPVKPRRALVRMFSAVLGLLAGITFVITRHLLDRGIRHPDQLAELTGVSVLGSVPFSPLQHQYSHSSKKEKGKHEVSTVLAQVSPEDLSVEALRSLRTSLHFSLLDGGKVVSISGPSPGGGKSFISVNLAHLFSETGKKVVLIDGDMRRGHIHEYIGDASRHKGLSDVLIGDVEFSKVIVPLGGSSVDVLPAGTVPPNPSELLLGLNFDALMTDLRDRYDLVIIDTPPVLAVTDPVVISAKCDLTFVVVKEGASTPAEVQSTVHRLNSDGDKDAVTGIVFNGFQQKKSGYGYYNYYQYEYKSSSN